MKEILFYISEPSGIHGRPVVMEIDPPPWWGVLTPLSILMCLTPFARPDKVFPVTSWHQPTMFFIKFSLPDEHPAWFQPHRTRRSRDNVSQERYLTFDPSIFDVSLDCLELRPWNLGNLNYYGWFTSGPRLRVIRHQERSDRYPKMGSPSNRCIPTWVLGVGWNPRCDAIHTNPAPLRSMIICFLNLSERIWSETS